MTLSQIITKCGYHISLVVGKNQGGPGSPYNSRHHGLSMYDGVGVGGDGEPHQSLMKVGRKHHMCNCYVAHKGTDTDSAESETEKGGAILRACVGYI